MREALRSVKRFLSSAAWKDYVIAPFGALADTDTDDKLNAYIRAGGNTVFHPIGTASMSPKGASYGVVDPDLLLKGTSGLRIVDASVLVCFLRFFDIIISTYHSPFYLQLQPFVPGAHPQFHVYIVGERASDLVKRLWNL